MNYYVSTSGSDSNAGTQSAPWRHINYAASKAGLFGFTRSVARELASRGITANAIAPGFVETDMTAGLNPETRDGILKQIPLGSFGQPEDIALYLPPEGAARPTTY